MVPDTNTIIAYLAGEEVMVRAFSQWREEGPLFLPTVVESEVLSFNKWDKVERSVTEQFIEENFTSIPFDRPIARIAARLRGAIRIKFPDAAIAASALYLHVPLVTRNVKDFKSVPDLEIVSL